MLYATHVNSINMLFCIFYKAVIRWECSTLGSNCSELQVPSFIVNERTKGTTVTPPGPKEKRVAARVNDGADDF